MKLKKITLISLVLSLVFALSSCALAQSGPTDLSKLTLGQEDVSFGKYTWTVLDIKDDRALLITNEVVEKAPFNNEYKSIDWSGSDLRKYLNDKFLNENFTEEEIEKIIEVMNTTPDNPWAGTSGGGNTLDRIFLLSIEEVVKYYGDSGQLESGNPNNELHIEDEFNEARIAKSDGSKLWWWLRSPGHTSKFAAAITHSGRLEVGGYFVQEEFGIRPVLWVDMK